MKTTFSKEEYRLVMTFEGKLDTAASAQAERDMKVLYDSEGRDIILDMTSLDYISSSGLRLLLNLLKHARTSGSSVCVKGPSDYLRQVFNETGFSRLFKMVE